MYVVVLALLLGAGVSLVVGVLTSAAGWLIACIVLSLLALLLGLIRGRGFRAQGAPAAPGPGEISVWVLDGRPRYHRQRCSMLDGKAAEAISLPQASEDGFTPCSLCTPAVYIPAG